MTGCNAEGNDDGACSVLNEFANNEPSLLCRILVAQLRTSFVACHWGAHDGADARVCWMHARLRPTKSCLCAMLRRDDPRAVVHRCGAVRRLSIHALQWCGSSIRRRDTVSQQCCPTRGPHAL